MINKTPPKGMRDFLPNEVQFRSQLLDTIKSVYERYGFLQIETPCVEDLSLLLSKQGGDNEKLIYKILKRGEKLERAEGELADLGLRFDLTLPLARYYANNIGELPPVVKAMHLGNVFRAERNQRGRFRQLYQCDIDIINEPSILAEVELLNATRSALTAVGLGNCTIKINDRRILKSLVDYCGFLPQSQVKVFITLDKLDKIGIQAVKDELLVDNSIDAVNKLTSTLDVIINSQDSLNQCKLLLQGMCDEAFDSIQSIIDATGTVFDITLVRGMNYYTGTIFEAYTAEESFAIAGGGRYDCLIEKISGVHTCACGFSIGFERIAMILQEKSPLQPEQMSAIIVDRQDLDNLTNIMQLASECRRRQPCSIFSRNKNVGYQIQSLRKAGYTTIYFYDRQGYLRDSEK
ncbi:MAG: histidine--tRNA ligase [Clostridia bacterium]|nr:histidine--tRNA ligase [Clostridia bacterium]